MSDPAALALKGLLDSALSGDVPRLAQMVVESTREDGRVNLSWGETVFDGVPCSSAYVNRQAGDVVTVEISAAGWLVQPPAGGQPALVTPDDIKGMLTKGDLDDYVKVGDAEQTTLTWGTAVPSGTGWRQASQMWVRDNQVYAQLATASDPPPVKPRPKTWPRATPSPTGDALYSGGRRYSAYNGGHPVQGGYGNYAGAWFYGSRIADACAGKSVARMQVKLVRRASGTSRPVRPELFLHDAAGVTYAIPSMHHGWTGAGLSRGEAHWFDIPAAQAALLASGSAKGIGVKASGGYVLLFTADSGGFAIDFNN